MTSNPRVSIIHAHPKTQPSPWIANLATQLRQDGVDALLDAWELKVGQDVPAYLEEMITSPAIERVVVIIDEAFIENFQQDTEVQLLRQALYNNVHQDKIIPLVHLPTYQHHLIPPYLASRLAIYTSHNSHYQQLLKSIYTHLGEQKPPLGERPKNLGGYFSAFSYLQKLEQSKDHNEESIAFFEDFVQACQQAERQHYSDLSAAWREWLEKVVKTREHSHPLDTTYLIEALEKLLTPFANTYFLHHLFLTAIVIGFQKRNFKYLSKLLYGQYYVEGTSHSFIIFNCYDKVPPLKHPIDGSTASQVEHNAQRAVELKNRAASLAMNGLLKQHYTKQQLVEADLMCYYISMMNKQYWTPILALYIQPTTYPISWLRKLGMKKFFEKTKVLYGVETTEAFAKKVNIAYLQEQQNNIPDKVRPLSETGLPRRVGVD